MLIELHHNTLQPSARAVLTYLSPLFVVAKTQGKCPRLSGWRSIRSCRYSQIEWCAAMQAVLQNLSQPCNTTGRSVPFWSGLAKLFFRVFVVIHVKTCHQEQIRLLQCSTSAMSIKIRVRDCDTHGRHGDTKRRPTLGVILTSLFIQIHIHLYPIVVGDGDHPVLAASQPVQGKILKKLAAQSAAPNLTREGARKIERSRSGMRVGGHEKNRSTFHPQYHNTRGDGVDSGIVREKTKVYLKLRTFHPGKLTRT